MVLFYRKDQALLFAAVERFGDDAHIAADFFAVDQLQGRVRNFAMDQRLHLLRGFHNFTDKDLQSIVQTGGLTGIGLYR